MNFIKTDSYEKMSRICANIIFAQIINNLQAQIDGQNTNGEIALS